MRVLFLATTVGLAGSLFACAPSLNWRDVPVGDTALTALFPCKPDDAQRTVPLADEAQVLTMRSCDAAGLTYAIGHARLADPARTERALLQWRDATRNGLGPLPVAVSVQPPPHSPALPQLLALQATRDPSQQPAQTLQGLWFARGPDIFAAFVLGERLASDATEPFFSGLRLR